MNLPPLEMLGLAYDLGAGRPGAASGPSTLRSLSVAERLRALKLEVHDGTDLRSAPWPTDPLRGEKIRHLPLILPFLQQTLCAIEELYLRGNMPVVLGGDHSLSIATVAGAVRSWQRLSGPEARLGLLWVDAHPDLNTPETSPSGNLHGMPVATLLGRGEKLLTELGGFSPKLRPEDIALVGIRDVDPGERAFIQAEGILAFSMKEIDQLGMGVVMERALAQVTRHTGGFYLSYDLDVSDPNLAPGVGSPVRGGITLRESHLVMEMVAETTKLFGIEIVELNPSLDFNNTTAELAISLLESAVGRSIL